MCGYEGRGVPLTCTATVAEYCVHCRARTYQSRDGVCELCGRDAEGPDATATAEALVSPSQRGADVASVGTAVVATDPEAGLHPERFSHD